MAEIYKVDQTARKFLFEGVQGENEARSIQFDITPWTTELGNGAVTATAKRPTDAVPYPVTVTRDGNTVTWKPTSTDTAIDGAGMFQLEYTVDDVLAKTCIWSTMVAPSLDPAGDPPDPYDNWLAEMREIAADAIQAAQDADESADDAQAEVYEAEAWAKGTKNGTPVPSTADQYQNNAKYWAEQSLANQYGAYIVKSASGDIASFTDGADNVPMKSVNVTITPKQSGSGDPSPDNVRPITGWTDADVTVVGKNLLSNDVYNLAPSGSTIASGASYRSAWCAVKGGETYTITRDAISGNRFRLYGTEEEPANGVVVTGLDADNDTALTMTVAIPDNIRYLFVYLANDGSTITSKLQLELGSTATVYAPYTGHTTPVPLGQTVYGGSVNPISGELVIDHATASLSNRSWTRNTQGENAIEVYTSSGFNGVKANGITNIISDKLETTTRFLNSSTVFGVRGFANDGSVGVQLPKTSATTDAEAKTFIDNLNATVVFELKNPTTVQLTPTQVASLLGTNNVWADCGSVAVEYRADPTLAYAELEALILENI